MRFSETDQNGKLEWLIQRRLCTVKIRAACRLSAGRIIQYANGIVDFQQDNCIGCGYCIAGCPFNIPRLNKEDNRVYKCTLCGSRQRRAGACLREDLSDRRYPLRHQERDAGVATARG
jgi:Fe-S-cluster-containing dehydrogenase component